jgi:hypothetical protein
MDKETFNNGEIFIASTKIIDHLLDENIKPAKNTKKELGLDFRKWGVRLSLTAFTETISDCLAFVPYYDNVQYNKYSLPATGTLVDYTNGRLYFDGELQQANRVVDFNLYNRVLNSYSIYKKGIEYSLNFSKIKELNTSIIIDGAYLYNEKTQELPFYDNSTLTREKDFVGVYPEGKRNIAQMLNTNFRFVTHIPELRMVFSLTAQVLWFEKYQTQYDEAFYSEDGKDLFINPIACLDKDGNYRDLTGFDILNSEYKLLIKKENAREYIQEVYPITTTVNFKLSKEIGQRFNISFYANNLFNYIQRHKLTNLNSYVFRNQSLFFGAMLKIKL